jgi:hypothetical protein
MDEKMGVEKAVNFMYRFLPDHEGSIVIDNPLIRLLLLIPM